MINDFDHYIFVEVETLCLNLREWFWPLDSGVLSKKVVKSENHWAYGQNPMDLQ